MRIGKRNRQGLRRMQNDRYINTNHYHTAYLRNGGCGDIQEKERTMKLYDINSEMQSLMNQTTEDGEISTETLDAIMNLTLTESEKIEGIVSYIKDLQSDAKAIKKEEETLKSRRQIKENKAIFLSEYVKNYLINTKRDRFETPKCLLSFRESESVKILDENLIPKKYLFAEYKISVADIRVALKNGKKVKGAILQENKNLQIK
jgi:hypothetical protein